MLNKIDTNSDLGEGQKTGIKQFIATGSFDLTEGDFESLKGQTKENNDLITAFGTGEELTKAAQNAGFESGDEFIEAYLKAI